MNNLDIYNAVRIVPPEAKKTIVAGRTKGFTDINPMWRLKTLTEQFGIAGIGWYYTIDKMWTEKGANEVVSAFVEISLFVKVQNEWSMPIKGIGGSAFVSKENSGLYTSDECYKMALTDAISVSCKALGMGADVYYEKDRTKYDELKSQPKEQDKTKPKEYKCVDCGKLFEAFTDKKGNAWNAGQVFHMAESNNPDKKARCKACRMKQEGIQNE